MPPHRSSSGSSSGSFVNDQSDFNIHCFTSARNNVSQPYPSPTSVYNHSNCHDPFNDDFSDLGLHDFCVANRRIARRKLEHLQIDPYATGLLSRGVQTTMDCRGPMTGF